MTATEQQQLWDAETIASWQRSVFAAAEKVDRLRAHEAECKEDWKDAVLGRKQAQAELEAVVRNGDPRKYPLFQRPPQENGQAEPERDPGLIPPPLAPPAEPSGEKPAPKRRKRKEG